MRFGKARVPRTELDAGEGRKGWKRSQWGDVGRELINIRVIEAEGLGIASSG